MISGKIKEYREKAGLTQAQLGEAIGYERSTVARWENGSLEPFASVVKAIAEALNVSVSSLYE